MTATATKLRKVTVTPPSAARRAAGMAKAAGWELEPSDVPDGVPDEALASSKGAVLVVPGNAQVPKTLRRIVVVHEGSPLVAPGAKLADETALNSGAEIVVLHVASGTRPTVPGSLPALRFADHSGYGWEDWRAEFIRRFCRTSKGLRVSLVVTHGDPTEEIAPAIRRLRPDLVIATWKGRMGPERGRVLQVILGESRCPVLVVREG